MAGFRPKWTVWVAAILYAATIPSYADELSGAYAAILRGDLDTALGRVNELQARGKQDPAVQRVQDWLSSYSDVAKSREERNRQTFDWNVGHAKEDLASGASDKLYRALTFATRAVPYAADAKAYAAESWIRELTEKCRTAAQAHADAGAWAHAHAYYLALERIHGDDSEFKPLREEAARHLRIEILYEDKEALERRTKDVRTEILQIALKQINDNYFERPDFKQIALGGLEYTQALTTATKLRTHLDGLANQASRQLFQDRIATLLANVKAQERYNWRDTLSLFEEVLRINRTTVELPLELLTIEFLEGGLNKLDDFTSMIWPADAVDFDKMMLGGFEGVGIQLGVDEETGRLKVVSPLENSPALEAGIRPDDLIVEVDGGSTKGWTTDDAVRNIMGPSGSVVQLTMFRPATGEYIKFDLKRREIVLKTVRGWERTSGARGDEWNFMLDPAEGVAYVRVTGFHPETDTELREALRAAERQGMRALVLDLRYNPGGLLDVAVDTVSAFVSRGEVVSTRGRRSDERQELDVTGRVAFRDLPLVILVNDASASASEILAGALKDHDRAIVIGQRTFGKGSVQRVFPVGPSRARLKLTTALYYLPDGRSPHRAQGATVWGVDPSLKLELTPKEEREIIQQQNRALVIHNGQGGADEVKLSPDAIATLKNEENKDDEDSDLKPLLVDADFELLNSDPYDTPPTDPQLQYALLQLRVKLAGGLPWPTHVAAATNG